MTWKELINLSKGNRIGTTNQLRGYAQAALAFLGYEEGYEPERLPVPPPIPKFEDDIPVMYVAPRSGTGKNYCRRLRYRGWTPGVIGYFEDGTSKVIRMVPKDCLNLLHGYGYYGVFCTPLKLVVIPRDMLIEKVRLEVKENKKMENILEEETYRVLPRIVHINRCGLFVENIEFFNCPREKIVRVPVQVVVVGEEDSIAKKTGNYIQQVKFWINVECRGDQVPAAMEVDVSQMTFGSEIYAKDLEITLPEGVRLWRKETYGEELIVRVGGREKKDAAYYQQLLKEKEGSKNDKKKSKRKV